MTCKHYVTHKVAHLKRSLRGLEKRRVEAIGVKADQRKDFVRSFVAAKVCVVVVGRNAN